MEQEPVEHVVAHAAGEISADDLRGFVVHRDAVGQLDMDSASFNHLFVDVLVEEFPDARFVFTIRDCYSWLDSYLKLLLRWRTRFREAGQDMPIWKTDYGRLLFGDFSWAPFASTERLHDSLTATGGPVLAALGGGQSSRPHATADRPQSRDPDGPTLTEP